MRRSLFLLLALALLLVSAAPASAKTTDKADIYDFDTAVAIGGGAHTTLQRTADSVSLQYHSRSLTPGNAYTVWFAIFNDPSACWDSPDDAEDGCGEGDVGTGRSSVFYSGAGGVANGEGNLNISGSLSELNPEDRQNLLAAIGAPQQGFTDAQGAEIHTILRDHGPSTGHAHQVETYEGDCTSASSFGLTSVPHDGALELFACVDIQFSVHQA